MKHLFPEIERVEFKRNPLELVSCEIKFEPSLKIETTASELQDALKDRLPTYERRANPGVSLDVAPLLPPEYLSRLSVVSHVFSNDTETVEILFNTMKVSTSEYRRWESFSELIFKTLELMKGLYDRNSFIFRLHFKNVIARSRLDLKGSSWQDLLKPYIVAEMATEEIQQVNCQTAVRMLAFPMPDDESFVVLHHGLAEEQDGDQETCYLIESNFFSQEVGYENAASTLNFFSNEAGRLFHWCIRDRLKEAMGPAKIS